MRLGIVTGMVAEARLLKGVECALVSGGGDVESTRRKVDSLIIGGATHLVSFGIAGALDPSLKPGDLLLATQVVLPDGTAIETSSTWREKAAEKIATAQSVPVAGASTAAATRPEKAALYRASGAAAVDMESHHVAVAAARHKLPFIVIRAVADTAEDELPPAALVGLNKEGRPAIGAVLLSLLGNPLQLPALLQLAGRSNIALKALLRGRAGLL